MNSFDEMSAALNEAQEKIRVADKFVGRMANLIVGRLRLGDVSHYNLCRLKKELENYNMHTQKWKD